ncbi:hypothetical protein IQ03_01081 [Gemmobacter caeni]|uniref:Uncharacterized protein n=1 Tax=Gemmobacter caeni TaxID=589035 RepID=A0A2T6B882_9RHOB|nr:hypothetical protein [Gemmobacter caeni]PTX52291.1 hypothetical protein C8N34_10269 [Gemmobacter caeni]TWJ02664.1 hypothetical protein IQ03_01081 [Gemmobacter caeni]
MSDWIDSLAYEGHTLDPHERLERSERLSLRIRMIWHRMGPGYPLTTRQIATLLPKDLAKRFDDRTHLYKSISALMRHAVNRGEFIGQDGEYEKLAEVRPPAAGIPKKDRTAWMYRVVDRCMCEGVLDPDQIRNEVPPALNRAYRTPEAVTGAILEVQRRIFCADTGSYQASAMEVLGIPTQHSLTGYEVQEILRAIRRGEIEIDRGLADQFRLRIEFYPGGDFDPSEVSFIENLGSHEAAQIAYLEARDASGLDLRRFLPGEVFDHTGEHVARISYDGRLWAPDPLTTGGTPLAEAPVRRDPEDVLVWMVGTRDSVLQDAYTAGPDNAPDLLKLAMREGEILIGKDRRGEVRVVREMGPDGCVDLPGGLDALRADDAPEP